MTVQGEAYRSKSRGTALLLSQPPADLMVMLPAAPSVLWYPWIIPLYWKPWSMCASACKSALHMHATPAEARRGQRHITELRSAWWVLGAEHCGSWELNPGPSPLQEQPLSHLSRPTRSRCCCCCIHTVLLTFTPSHKSLSVRASFGSTWTFSGLALTCADWLRGKAIQGCSCRLCASWVYHAQFLVLCYLTLATATRVRLVLSGFSFQSWPGVMDELSELKEFYDPDTVELMTWIK